MQSRPPITAHRFARLIAWLCTLLAWVALGAPAHRRRRTCTAATLRFLTACVIVHIAADYARPIKRPIPRRYGKPPRKRVPRRALIGAWLRGRLRVRGGVIAQAKHLIGVLASRHAIARGFANRHRKPFSRLAPILACAGVAPRINALALPTPIANTS